MKTYEELMEILSKNGVECEEHGASFLYKQSPDGERGYLDPREAMVGNAVKEEIEANPQNYPENIIANIDRMFPEITEDDSYVFQGIPVGVMRKRMGWNNIDLSRDIVTEERTVLGEVEIPVRIYHQKTEKPNRPCLVFFHGGGFIAGSMEVVENPCKAIAQKADAVVISVDYRLAPEHPFPEGFHDCFDVVRWAWENAEELGIDRLKLGVAGDSAGGNLAAVCALRDRDEKSGMIHYQALLYATLMRGDGSEYPGYYWNLDMYDNKADDSYIKGACTWIKESGNVLNVTYVQEYDRHHPYISPMDAESYEGLPKTLIATAEYDFLKAECNLYGTRLKAAGVPVRNICYGGVAHAYLDKYGFFPQAEDCVNEIAEDLKNL